MAVCEAFGGLLENEFGHLFVELLAPANEAQQITARAQLHHEAEMVASLERVVQLDDVEVMRQMLQYLQVLSDFFLALNLFIHVFLAHAFDGHEMTTEFVLGNHHFPEGALAKLVADPVKLMRCRDRLAHLLKVGHYHSH
mmetsp:Transcript_36092/g.47442  ORF Transcript_36092/g.47442 Transcript_36092/m.47442 type:complete len:140 (-) Transcript_36092:99-518(-)|eukprot:CAMPEP_0185575248 /NCGR_PEP_ID=MMETSP0434-20130131/6499_1 /TAXON_ID=626734 ORGANISM="Favella taraikaensis, Strain Fe Narragansett Bay" /NCGR_SAMPLE_ID=MMETSP0434 /ASSEMBLY_ACC=CAM_ASM_000379 /LENGTH=139 /DNA_ID=CAMNT_0028192077 /DNA_START=1565 /DNA_END=1984 /DNA_ORIENTATION=-